MFSTCVDSELAELSSLEELCLISRHSSWLDEVVEEIQSCTLGLRFLRMLFWSALTSEDTDDDDDPQIRLILVDINNIRDVYWGKSRKVAPFPLVSTRSEFDHWILDLQGRIQNSTKIFEVSCRRLLSHGSLRCNSLEKKQHTGKFLEAILVNLKDLYKCKSDDESVLLKKQIATLEKKLTLLHHLFELTPKQWRSFEEMREFKVVVHAFAHYSASLVFMYWVKAIDEEPTTTEMNVLLFDVLRKYKPCVPVLQAFYGRFLKEMKLSQFEPLLLGRIIQIFLDLLLENLVMHISEEDFQILQESLMFVIAFLADPLDQYAHNEDLMTIAKFEVLVLSGDETSEINLAKAKERFNEFMHKVKPVKDNIRIVYHENRDSFSYDFPKINGLGSFDFILHNVGSLMDQMNRDKYFIPFAKHLIIEIEEELMSLRPYLNDLFERQKEHKELKETWFKVINLAYQTEYAINSCTVTGHQLWFNMARLMEVLDKLKDVKSEVEEIEGKKTYDGAILRSSNRVPEGPSGLSFNEVMVGLEEEANKIDEYLIYGSKSLDIVAIVGMPGLGKTTMAKKVYNAPAVRNYFHVFAYCIVSQVYNNRRILINILADIRGKYDKLDGMSEEDLGHMLRMCLKGKRYLIVMDDIREVNAWNEVENSFPDDGNGSRVIFTARIHHVALQAKRGCIIHHLRFLSKKESWELLQIKVFRAKYFPPAFAEVGKMIAEKCGGLPLTLNLISCLLVRSERDLSLWNEISDAISFYVSTGDLMSVLELIYQYLPEYLKPSFLYFGVFANDTIIHVNKLTLLWIAEGFVQNANGKSLKHVAKEYLCDLVGRSLVIAKERSSYGGIKSCQMHDLVHEFCQGKSQEESFFQLIDGNKGLTSSSSTIHNPYRVCIHMKGKYLKEAPKICPNIHSLLSTAVHDAGYLKLVQVMDLKDLNRWGNLKPVHLRFLAGPTIPGAIIPYFISNLWNLEIMILTGRSVLELPETMLNMTSLIHVDVGRCFLSKSRVKKGEAYPQMVNLESFSSPTIYSTKDLEELLQRSPSLKKLSFHYEYEEKLEKISDTLIYNEPRKDFQFPKLDSLSKLESLKVSSTKELCLHPFKFPSFLKKLTLSGGGNLPWRYLPKISEMPCLEVLKLLNNAFVGPKWDMEDTRFPKLKFLRLEFLDFQDWIVSLYSFPSLEVLIVSRCDHLNTIPRCFKEMATLKRIEGFGSRKAVTEVVETHESLEQIPFEEIATLKRIEGFGSLKAATKVVETHETTEQIPFDEIATLKRIEGFGSRKAATKVHETAEQIPLALVGFFLENFKKFIIYNCNLIGGQDEKIKKVIDDLDLLKAFAIEYSKVDTDSNALLHQLANDVRKTAYQAENAIEDYIICKTLQQNRGFGSKTLKFFRHVSDLKQIGKQIEDVSANVTKLIEKREPLGSEALKDPSANKGVKMRKKVLVVEEDNVVGFEEEAAAVIKLLKGGSQQLEVISIIGMLGLGKTTLAKKVLKDPEVDFEFFPTVFVNVSQVYNSKKVFINILRTLNCTATRDMNDDDDDGLAKKLRKELSSKKYLIVMDDVWSRFAWDDLKVAFPNNNKGSRVLITSRYLSVASHASPSKEPYILRVRTSDESRELLRRKVFGENEIPGQLLEYALQIVKKCDGLPLAIVVVAGILLKPHRMVDGWKKVAENFGDHVARDQSQLNDMLKLSFDHLPYHLKACFLYLGVFPEDFEIPVWKLLKLWIAEGFIHIYWDTTLEVIAEGYLEGLVDRSLVMVGRRKPNGQIKTCHIHNILRVLCIEEALNQNIFVDTKRFDQSTFSIQHPNISSYRRICVNSNVFDYVASKHSSNKVRSFLAFPKKQTTVPLGLVSSILKPFKLLRVLEVKSFKFTTFPPELVDLILLKYIAMFCDFKIIPKNFSNLRNLQTIIIDTASETLEIAADISKLALLMHLQTNASTSLGKCQEPSVPNANLHALFTISPESCTAEMFERYPKLKKLGIRGKLAIIILDNGEFSFFNAFAKLEFLENLKLINENDETSRLHALPRETNFPRNLRRLTLMNTFLDWSQISTLGMLQNLEVLKLKDNAFDGEIWETEDGGFRCLKILHIGYTQKLVGWKANASHFPMLTSLYLRRCDNLEAIPLGFADIPSLQTIDLYCCNKPSMVASAREIQVHKLQQAQQKNNKTFHFKLAVFPPDQ